MDKWRLGTAALDVLKTAYPQLFEIDNMESLTARERTAQAGLFAIMQMDSDQWMMHETPGKQQVADLLPTIE